MEIIITYETTCIKEWKPYICRISILLCMQFHMCIFWFFCAVHGPSKTFFFKFEKSLYSFEILFNQTLIKSLGGTKILSFNEVFNSLSLCFVYLVLFYKPFQTLIIVLLVQYRYTVTIQHPVRLIVDWFFRRCIYIYINPLIN